MEKVIKKKHIITLLLVLAVVVSLFSNNKTEKVLAGATSYTNALDFYNSTSINNDSHSEVYNGCFYIANCAKKAKSSTTVKYSTLGYDSVVII